MPMPSLSQGSPFNVFADMAIKLNICTKNTTSSNILIKAAALVAIAVVAVLMGDCRS